MTHIGPDGDWDPRVDAGGRHADHADFGKDCCDPVLVAFLATLAVLALLAVLVTINGVLG